MSEDEKIDIENLIMDLEDAFWITEKVKNDYPELRNRKEYRQILKAIETLEQEHDVLYKFLKED